MRDLVTTIRKLYTRQGTDENVPVNTKLVNVYIIVFRQRAFLTEFQKSKSFQTNNSKQTSIQSKREFFHVSKHVYTVNFEND